MRELDLIEERAERRATRLALFVLPFFVVGLIGYNVLSCSPCDGELTRAWHAGRADLVEQFGHPQTAMSCLSR